jgi:predicted MFS family arabinose efflux permease
MPAPPPGRSARIDIPGAALLAGGLILVLLAVSETSLWSGQRVLAVTLTVAGLILLAGWAAYEMRAAAPLVDVRLVRHRAVAAANAAMLTGGAGMYLLLTLLVRYAQTPHSAGYGFGLTTFEAGLVLVPFSAFGFIAGKVTPKAGQRAGSAAMLAVSALVVLAAFAVFALARSALADVLAAMAILGYGVGGFSAAMPPVILAVTSPGETSSAMGFNQVVRSTGFALGSAIGGLILAAGTPAAHLFPASSAYTTAAWTGAVLMAVSAATALFR